MPIPKKVDNSRRTVQHGDVNGWPWRLLGTGEVVVGTANHGEWQKFTFSMTRYEDKDVDSCVLGEIEDRRASARALDLGYQTPRFGPNWTGALPCHLLLQCLNV